MATINSKAFIDKIIAGNGWHPDTGDESAFDNPRVAVIVEYKSKSNEICWGITFVTDRNQYRYLEESEYVRDPKVIWRASDNVH